MLHVALFVVLIVSLGLFQSCGGCAGTACICKGDRGPQVSSLDRLVKDLLFYHFIIKTWKINGAFT